MRLAFGDCIYDSGRREVSRAGRTLPLTPKSLALLELLIERHPDAVSKKEIHERVWAGTFVTDTSLANLAAGLRAALGDDAARPGIIRTVHRYGYAFCAEVVPVSRDDAMSRRDRIACRLLWDDREIQLAPGENILGRAMDAAVWIDDSAVSRRHARITVGEDGATLEDLGSKNGTRLRGRRIAARARLQDRDVIRVGPATMTFRLHRATGPTETAADEEPGS